MAAVVDLVAVTAFVVIGRSSHGEDPLGVLHTLWPFAAGALIGWLTSRAWRAPLALVPTGLVVWICTVAIGIALRVHRRRRPPLVRDRDGARARRVPAGMACRRGGVPSCRAASRR